MKRVDSDALEIITRALGITGRGAQVTEFLDGAVDQSLDISQLVRRGRTFGRSAGIYNAVLRNIHTDAETLTTQVEPYNQTVGNVNGYPALVNDRFDIWLLLAAIRQNSGTGTFTGLLLLDTPITQQGFGEDDSGSAVATSSAMPLAFWDSIVVAPGATIGLQENGDPLARIGLRLRRDTALALRFISTSSLTATFSCLLTLGVFPVGLGQDVLL